MAKLKVTQVKSVIKRLENQKRTIKALGLGRPGYENIVPDNAQIQGMIEKVNHLIKVEKVS